MFQRGTIYYAYCANIQVSKILSALERREGNSKLLLCEHAQPCDAFSFISNNFMFTELLCFILQIMSMYEI